MFYLYALALFTQAQLIMPDSTVNRAGCRGCWMRLSEAIVLGAARDSGGRFGDTQIVRSSTNGDLVVPKPLHPERLFVYSKAGVFKHSLRFDSVGRGNPGAIHIVDGELVVFNNGRGQIVSVSPGRPPQVRSAYPGSVRRAARLSNGEWLVNGDFRTSNLIGMPLHILSRDGVAQSFGSITREYRPDRPLEGWRHIHSFRQDSVLSLPMTSPTLEVWTHAGQFLHRSTLDGLPQFIPWSEGQRWSLDSAPPSVIDDMMIESSGQIWLLVSVASPSWKASMAVTTTADGPLVLPRDWTQALSSWVVVVDGVTKRVLYAARFREYLRQFLPDGRVLGLRGTPNKSESLLVFRISSSVSATAGF